MVKSNQVFAYGSLVNSRAQPAGVRTEPGILHGWIRQWMHCVETSNGRVCVLTIVRRPKAKLLGLILINDDQKLANLDDREIGYSRVRVSVRPSSWPRGPKTLSCFAYVGDTPHHRPGSLEFPIWRSYLDCVLSGYLELGGAQAVERFIASTEGWESPILDDRAQPRYPRAINLRSDEQDTIDGVLTRSGLLRNLVTANEEKSPRRKS